MYKSKKHRVSVIIATKNRPTDLDRCIKAIQNNTQKPFEIIIVDQSDTFTKHIQISSHIQHYHYQMGGKSAALNYGLTKAKGDILAFTDDDCIVHNTWIATIQKLFLQTRISGFFGRTLSYRPHDHKNEICPCTNDRTTREISTKPCYHAKHLGFGNNMAFRKSIFEHVGNFNTLLGPGSIGSNAEDAEFAMRALSRSFTLAFEPLMRVYHNKWLSLQDMKRQNLSYVCGEMACYTPFALQGFRFAQIIIKNNLIQALRETKALFRSPKEHRDDSLHVYWKIQWMKLRGFIVGCYIYISKRGDNTNTISPSNMINS